MRQARLGLCERRAWREGPQFLGNSDTSASYSAERRLARAGRWLTCAETETVLWSELIEIQYRFDDWSGRSLLSLFGAGGYESIGSDSARNALRLP
jgi:hypothetical protein